MTQQTPARLKPAGFWQIARRWAKRNLHRVAQGGVHPCHPTGQLLAEQAPRPRWSQVLGVGDRESTQPGCEREAGAIPVSDREPDPPRPCCNRPAEHRQAGSRATSAHAGAAALSADRGLPARGESDRTKPPTAAASRKGQGRAVPNRKAVLRRGRRAQAQAPTSRGPPGPAKRRGPPPPDQPSPPRRRRGNPVTPSAVTCRPPAGPCAPHSGPRRPLIRPRLSPPRRPRPLPPRRFRVAPGRGGGRSPWRRGGLGWGRGATRGVAIETGGRAPKPRPLAGGARAPLAPGGAVGRWGGWAGGKAVIHRPGSP